MLNRRLSGSLPPRRARRGLTLVELLIVIVLLGIVAGGMMGIIVKQQQFYAGSSGVMDTRANVREGMAVLTSDLRAVAPAQSDIYSMGRTFIEFRLTVGTAVICTLDPTRTVVTVPPLQLAQRNGYTAWISAPQNGDSVLVFDPGAKAGTTDDTWDADQLAADAQGNASCPTTTGLTTQASEQTNGWQITLQNALTSAYVTPGSAIRFFRRVRYELYQEADNNWYLGYFDCVPGRTPVCTALQPVGGPYLPAANAGPSGLELSYFDSTGATTTDPTQVRRIGVVLRSQSQSIVRTLGRQDGFYQDSLATDVAVRNF
jgi:prepilin-type N-terminal cleavage/methylation domain-containing protein